MSRLIALPPGGLAAPLRPGLRIAGGLLDRIRRWPVESQQVARRNAMLACTTLSARRFEREDVEDYLQERASARVLASSATAHG